MAGSIRDLTSRCSVVIPEVQLKGSRENCPSQIIFPLKLLLTVFIYSIDSILVILVGPMAFFLKMHAWLVGENTNSRSILCSLVYHLGRQIPCNSFIGIKGQRKVYCKG